ncbi:MAG TPA: cytochrome P450 [Stackebrandtia sp.]|jgi:cytochrome P450|uniref:cytochrome P450 n=1 Tax=Stackebrandtia sp. TaxID=2023065 RepID=UPI002D75F6D2|nr:cytochrome P450 [Stackebrandtia sp.]HZE41489.1 cytochrome P450 [Stackebrandtia sp.]
MTEQSTTEDLQLPLTRSCPFDPPEQYARLRAERPVAKVTTPVGGTAYVITRHADVRRLLADSRLSNRRDAPGFPLFAPLPASQARRFSPSLVGMDPPDHTTVRRWVVNEFTVKRMQALRPRIQQIVDECVDGMLDGPRPVDLVEALSLPVPSLVICELLGVPYEDHEYFQERTAKLVNFNTPVEERREGLNEVWDYLDGLVRRAEDDPKDDLIGRLIVKNRAAGVYDHDKITDLARILLVAGHETTANMISLGVLALLENPGQLEALRREPALVSDAVEELLRFFSIADGVTARAVLEDLEVDGVTIRAGEGVYLSGAAANHDPEVFAEPGSLDVRRGAKHHVAFGYGIHQCLGQNLARMELEIVYRTLFDRIPGLTLATAYADVKFKADAAIHGLYELPVTW